MALLRDRRYPVNARIEEGQSAYSRIEKCSSAGSLSARSGASGSQFTRLADAG